MNHNHDMTYMAWQPALVRLTKVGHPQQNDGAPSPCFINPQHIVSIEECVTRQNSIPDALGNRTPIGDYIICTAVGINQAFVYVTEDPSTVARLRDAAFGFSKSDGLKTV